MQLDPAPLPLPHNYMASSNPQPPPPHHYTPLPHPQNDTVFHHHRRTLLPLSLLLLLLVSFSLYLFYPSDPSLKIVRLKLKSVHVHTRPRLTLDVSMEVTIKVQNDDVYSMDYDALEVDVGYRGRRLGQVRFQNGHVRAFGSSYVDAEAEFNGIGVFSDVVLLLEDLAKGAVPFDTVTAVRGKLGVFVFHFPLRARVSCEIMVNMMNQTILRHNCYEIAITVPQSEGLRSFLVRELVNTVKEPWRSEVWNCQINIYCIYWSCEFVS